MTHFKTFVQYVVCCLIWLSPNVYATSLAMQHEDHGVAYALGDGNTSEDTISARLREQFNLYLQSSAGEHGQWINGVDVVIYNAAKQAVFSVDAAGPKLLVQLPSGRYTLEASYHGVRQTVEISHDARQTMRILLKWPSTSS